MRQPRALKTVGKICVAIACFLVIGTTSGEVVRAEQSTHSFQNPALEADVASYREELRTRIERLANRPSRLDLEKEVKRTQFSGNLRGTIEALEAVIGVGQEGFEVWLRLAEAWRAYAPDSRERSVAAYAAYLEASTDGQRAEALALTAKSLLSAHEWQAAALAFDVTLEIDKRADQVLGEEEDPVDSPFRYRDISTVFVGGKPELCVLFSQPLPTPAAYEYQRVISMEPPIDPLAVRVEGAELCIKNAEFGEEYVLQIAADFASANGIPLGEEILRSWSVPMRKPTLTFRQDAIVLPRYGAGDLALYSVNVTAIELKLLRIDDRNLVNEVVANAIGRNRVPVERVLTIADTFGELVASRNIAVTGQDLNRETVTLVPFEQMLPGAPKAGIYILTAQDADRRRREISSDHDRGESYAAQWVVQTDLSLVAYSSSKGTSVAVRSMTSGEPVSGATVALLARNNQVLSSGETGDDGVIELPLSQKGVLGGNRPAAIAAYLHGEKASDFNFLDLTRAAMDLTDWEISGRRVPGPIDAFVYSDRGTYRPGDTVHIVSLIRDSSGYAVAPEKIAPILKLYRPDGEEVDRITPSDAGGSSFQWDVRLHQTVRSGVWQVRVFLDENAPPIGVVSFEVQDFVPQTVELEVASQPDVIRAGIAGTLRLQARYLHGGPAPLLRGEARLTLRAEETPWPNHADFHFGHQTETYQAGTYEYRLRETNHEGITTFNIDVPELPDVRVPLTADIRLRVFEPSGRAVDRLVQIPARQAVPSIGIKANAGRRVEANSPASFDVVVLNSMGSPARDLDLRFRLVKEVDEYVVYEVASSKGQVRNIVREDVIEENVRLPVDALGRSTVSTDPLEVGRYRLEVADANSGASSSIRFVAGWWVWETAPELPNHLSVSVRCLQNECKPGEMAIVRVGNAPAAHGLLIVASDKLYYSKAVTLKPDSAEIPLKIDPAWGPGVYIGVEAFPAAKHGNVVLAPSRMLGMQWLPIDSSPQKLKVSLELPDVVRPREKIRIPIKVEEFSDEEPIWLTLSAVDEGVLNLSSFPAPDPVAHYFGQRALGTDLRDTYDRLIVAPRDGEPARFIKHAFGGDADHRRGLPVELKQPVALYSGVMAADSNGRLDLELDVPDYTGRLRFVVVAWSSSAVGSSTETRIVRDPVEVSVAAPTFLSPTDEVEASLLIRNMELPADNWRLQISSEGPLQIEGEPIALSMRLSRGVEYRQTLTMLVPESDHQRDEAQIIVKAQALGSELEIERRFEIAVRPPGTFTTTRLAKSDMVIGPGERLLVDPGLAQGYVRGSLRAVATFSASSADAYFQHLLANDESATSDTLEALASAFAHLHFDRQGRTRTSIDHKTDPVPEILSIIRLLAQRQGADGSFSRWPYVPRTEGDYSGRPETVELDTQYTTGFATAFLDRARQLGYDVAQSSLSKSLAYLAKKVGENWRAGHCRPESGASRNLFLLARFNLLPPDVLASYGIGCGNSETLSVADAAWLFAATRDYFDLPFVEQLEAYAIRALQESGALGAQAQQASLSAIELTDTLAAAKAAGWSRDHLAAVRATLNDALNSVDHASPELRVLLAMAAPAVLDSMPRAEGVRISLNEQLVGGSGSVHKVVVPWDKTDEPLSIRNVGNAPLYYDLALRGIPREAGHARDQSLSISRRLFSLNGDELQPEDMAGTPTWEVAHNDILAMVLELQDINESVDDVTIVDLLPAGFVLEDHFFDSGLGAYEWRSSILAESEESIEYIETRQERYIASVRMDEVHGDIFRIVYLVRAAAIGSFVLPGAFAEDRAQRSNWANSPAGRLIVLKRR